MITIIVYGDVQDLKYGHKEGEVSFAAFDIYQLDRKAFVNAFAFQTAYAYADLPKAPVLYTGELPNKETLEMLSMRDSELAPHLSEGIVIKSLGEREVGPRACLKLVSDRYLERA